MDKPKQRAIYFTDSEWEEVKSAAARSKHRSITVFVSEAVLKEAKKINRKANNETIK